MKHVVLIVKLRWMLFRNSLRSKSGWAELVSAVLLGLLLVPMDLVLSSGVFAAVYYLYGKPLLVPVMSCILAAVTLAWQLIPLLTASLGSDLDIEKFRPYPLSTRELFAIDLALGSFDPVALLAYPSLVAVVIACGARSTAALPPALISVGLFTGFNIILSRYVHRLIGALLANRKRREIIAVVVLLLLFSPQVIVSLTSHRRAADISDRRGGGEQAIDRTRKTIVAAGEYLAWLPPGVAARNLSLSLDEISIMGWLAMLGAAGFTIAAGWAEYARLVRDYYGRAPRRGRRRAEARRDQGAGQVQWEEGVILQAGNDLTAGGPVVGVEKGASRLPALRRWLPEGASGISRFSALDRLLPWLPLASTAILEKEIKYFFRSPRAFLIFIGPLLGTIILIVPGQVGSLTARAQSYRLAIIVLYTVLLDTQFFSNAFGFDWHGAKLYFMAPISGKSILIGKNMAATTIMCVQVIAIGMLFSVFTGQLGPRAIVDAMFAFAIGVPLNLVVGNYLSVLYPRAVEFSKVFGRSYSHLSQLVLLINLPLMALLVGAGPVLGAILDSVSVTYAIFTAETVLALVVYAATLGSAGRLLEGRAETFLQSLAARS
jgi:hypothetical protein